MSDKKVVLHDSALIKIEYLPEKKLIYHITNRPVTDADVPEWKIALNKGSQTLRDQKISKWLSDDRNNGPIPQAIIDWGATDFTSRTIDNGWKYWANVVPKDLIAAGTYVPLIQQFYDMGLRMQVFSSSDEALEWLDKMK